jgi:hypothetical protein
MDLFDAINPLLVVSGFVVGVLVGLTGVGGGLRKAALAESRDRDAATGRAGVGNVAHHGLALCVEP